MTRDFLQRRIGGGDDVTGPSGRGREKGEPKYAPGRRQGGRVTLSQNTLYIYIKSTLTDTHTRTHTLSRELVLRLASARQLLPSAHHNTFMNEVSVPYLEVAMKLVSQ